jgi:hypothetical protein
MRGISKLPSRLAVVAILVTALAPAFVAAQESTDDTPLGDLARSFRKKTPSSQEIIDNDNLSQVMDEVQSRHASSSTLRYSIDGAANAFRVSAPDVTCSLSFNANAKALLSSQYAQVELPPSELIKLDGPAVIDGDSIQVSVFNGTDWHVSEVEVALTIVKRGVEPEPEAYYGEAKLIPAVAGNSPQGPENRLEKHSDVTVVYHMRAAAAPSEVTVFRAPLNVDIGASQEWHWAIVQARGYPPQHFSAQASSSTQVPGTLTPPPPVISPAQESPQHATPSPLPQN